MTDELPSESIARLIAARIRGGGAPTNGAGHAMPQGALPMAPTVVLLVAAEAVAVARLQSVLASAPGEIRAVAVAGLQDVAGQVAELAPDAILLDLAAPSVSEPNADIRARSIARAVPLVALAGVIDEATVSAAARLGADEVLLSADLDGARLARAIRQTIERHRLRMQAEKMGREITVLRRRLLRLERLAALGQLVGSIAHELTEATSAVLTAVAPIQEQSAAFERLGDLLGASATGEAGAAAEAGATRGNALEDWVAEVDPRALAAAAKVAMSESHEAIQRIRHVSMRLRAVGGRTPAEVELLDLRRLVATTCESALSEVQGRARLVLELERVPPLCGDRDRLGQLILHLVRNAAEAMVSADHDRNEIRVSVRPRGSTIVLAVEDTGRGIPEWLRERLFRPFSTTQMNGQAAGFGLALCHEIARGHRGHITYASEVGRGARFEVVLPLDNGLAPPTPDAPP